MPTFILKNGTEELGKIISFIDSFTAGKYFSENYIFDLNLIVDEVVTNVIRHGGILSEDSEIEISLETDESNCIITVKDEGKEFNPLEYEPYDLNMKIEDRPIGNLGIVLVKAKCDEIYYERKNGKNILLMKKHLES